MTIAATPLTKKHSLFLFTTNQIAKTNYYDKTMENKQTKKRNKLIDKTQNY